MVLEGTAPAEQQPLQAREVPDPEPGAGEVRVRVEVCGVCRTDLHVVEGDLERRCDAVIPGHQVVGRIDRLGEAVEGLASGARVGVPWLSHTCGHCRYCERGDENLCADPRFTGWHRHGGYAELLVAPADFVYPLPDALDAREVAPLLCAGIIGYRALRRSRAGAGHRLGLWGFGGAAHLVIQLARHAGCEVFVFTRAHGELARELGAAWVGGSREDAPEPLDAGILFAPAGELVPVALRQLDRGATLAVAGIHLGEIPPLDYSRELFQERALTSVTANTREDGRELLRLAAEIPLRTRPTAYRLEDANRALVDLKRDRVQGAAVLEISRG